MDSRMTVADLDSAEKFIQRVVREAGQAVQKRFGKEGVHHMKSDHLGDVVTKADLLAEDIIVSHIRRAYPEHGIISEEGAPLNDQADYVWVIDPIDGTANFAARIPLFAVMVCLVHGDTVLLSAVYLPAMDEFFFARAGNGAYLNGHRIHCSKATLLSKSFGTSSSSLRRRTIRFMHNLLAVPDKEHILLAALGSIGVNGAYVAAGRRDWFIQAHGSTWDFAPVSLILKEAGCKVTDTKGNLWKFGTPEMVAANPTLHKQLLKLTKGI